MQIHGMAESRVDAIWEEVCFQGADGEVFTTKEIERALVKHAGFHPKTATLYFNKFARFAMANPELFSGVASKLIRVSNGHYRLGDNPEH